MSTMEQTNKQPRQSRSKADPSIFTEGGTFADLGLSGPVLEGVKKAGFELPTHVQSEVIPLVLKGRDILGQSRTGTGKTAAFALPILQKLDGTTPFSALVLTPTRELALQVAREFRELGRSTDLRTLPVYGGQPIRIQAGKLEKNPHIIVGTPGRVMDMHQRGLLPYDKLQIVVLDEVDRMLDIGFRDDIRRILGQVPAGRQTVFVSATISPEIERLARKYMDDPEKLILSESGSLTVQQVTQRYVSVHPWDKNRMLLHVLKKEKPELTLVFCRTKHTVDGLTSYLNRKGVEAHAIHGDMYQNKRNQVMKKLRDGELSVLVASDLAARGLDVDDITHVINYDLPDDPEVYIHRIGRTARAGREGWALAFVTPDQGELLTKVEKLANAYVEETDYPQFKPGPIPADVQAKLAEAQQRREQASERDRFTDRPSLPPQEKVDENAFPGGMVPSSLPGKRLKGRMRTRRR